MTRHAKFMTVATDALVNDTTDDDTVVGEMNGIVLAMVVVVVRYNCATICVGMRTKSWLGLLRLTTPPGNETE